MFKIPVQKIFNILLVYYWIIIYALGFLTKVERFSVAYLMYEVPIVIFLILMLKYILFMQSRLSIFLWIYLIPVIIISIIRMDLSTIITVSLTTITIITIINSKIQINLRLINSLFYLSIVLAVIFFHIGLNKYSYIPGLTNYSGVENSNEQWRISLFPNLLDSGLFSCFIFIINYFYNKERVSRLVVLLLSFYFLVFTGIRSAILLFLVFVIFLIISKVKTFKPSTFYLFYNWIIVLLIVLTLFSGSLLSHLRNNIHNEFFNKIVFKSQDKTVSDKQTKSISMRTWIWEQHYNIFKRNPLFGVGTFSFSKEVKGAVPGMIASESPLTTLLARVGLIVLPFIFFFWNLWLDALFRLNRYCYLLPLLIIISLLTYGSYFSPYNFIFLLIFASYNEVYQ
jgi:O-antigen ligase